MPYTSTDNVIAELAAGKSWRADFVKTYVGGTQVVGNWNDMSQSTGNPCQSLLGNIVPNYDFATSYYPWVLTTVSWAYTPATHLLTRTPNADYATSFAQVTLRMAAGCYYMVTFTTSGMAGTGLQPVLGGTAGTARTTNATFREILLCGTTDKLLKFQAPSGTGGGTIDLVSVQPVVGGFVPMNDLNEGALWHGGDVYSPNNDTKHLINFGAYAYGANTVPSVLMLVDVLGVYPRVPTGLTALTTSTLTGSDSFTSGILDDCQDAWNEEAIANVTSTLVVKSTESIPGGSANLNCCKFAITDTFATGKICDEVVNAALNSYPYQYSRWVYMWVRSSINLAAGDISFCTDENAALASSQDVLLPAITANTWTRVRLDVSAIAVADKDTVISIGFKAINDKNLTYSLYVDDVRFAVADYVIQNGTFTGSEAGWTLGANWAYNSNTVKRTANVSITTLSQTLLPVTQKCPYRITFDIVGRSAGTVTVSLGGGTASAARSTDGTYEEIVTCGTTNYSIVFTPDGTFDGAIDNVICTALVPRSDETTSTFGGGVRMYYVLDGTLTNGTGATTTAIQYTNQDGTQNRWNGATINQLVSDVQSHLPHSGTGAGKFGPFIPLQANDYGIRSIDRVQFSGAGNQADGAMTFVLCKPIASIPLTTLYVTAERDLLNMLPSLPRVRDGACLMFIWYSGAAAAAGVSVAGYLDFGWS
jgi:hypothetical protein